MGPGPSFQKSSKPVVATAGTRPFTYLCISGVLESDFFGVAVRCYPAGSVSASIRPAIAPNSRRDGAGS